MLVSPVSFKSLLVFNTSDLDEENKEKAFGKPKHSTPLLVRTTFQNNKQLEKYNLQDMFVHKEKLDGTIYNAKKNFAIELDKKYRPGMIKNDKRVFFTEADFYVNPRETEKRYFLTAATDEEEMAISKELNKGLVLLAANYR